MTLEELKEADWIYRSKKTLQTQHSIKQQQTQLLLNGMYYLLHRMHYIQSF